MLIVALAGWAATIFWESHTDAPVIDFTIMKDRNFAIASVLFFVFGVGLFGSTTLIPQMLQSLFGYRAINAGLVLGPGAFVITLLAPISAQLIQKKIVHPRILVMISLSITGFAMWHFSTFNLATDYPHFAWARALQGLGYGILLRPTPAPSGVLAIAPRSEQSSRASSLTNLFRNWGGRRLSASRS